MEVEPLLTINMHVLRFHINVEHWYRFTKFVFCLCTFSGFIRGLPEELAVHISFKPSFEEGSLLTVVW